MSSAERKADNISPPKFGRLVNFVIAPAGTETVDLEDDALNPDSPTPVHYWRDRYVTVMVEGNDCQFCASEAPGDVLTPGAAAGGAPALDVTRGAVIQAGKAPEMLFEGENSSWHYLQFASQLGCTVTMWVSSVKLHAPPSRLRGWRIRRRRRRRWSRRHGWRCRGHV